MLAGISVEKLLSMDLTFLHFLQAEELMVLLPDWFYKNVCKKKKSLGIQGKDTPPQKRTFLLFNIIKSGLLRWH